MERIRLERELPVDTGGTCLFITKYRRGEVAVPAMTRCGVVFIIALGLVVAAAPADALRVEVMTGTSVHAGLASIVLGETVPFPEWETRPFEESPYYAVRIWWDRWGLELVHDKMYLKTLPAGVQEFSVSHGYNLLMINRSFPGKTLDWYLGVGLVASHAEGIWRGEPFGGDAISTYHVGGIAGQIAAAKRLSLSDRLSLVVEGKVTAAHTGIPTAPALTIVPSLGGHLLVGLAFQI